MEEKVKSQPPPFEERFLSFQARENGLWPCECTHSMLGKKEPNSVQMSFHRLEAKGHMVAR